MFRIVFFEAIMIVSLAFSCIHKGDKKYEKAIKDNSPCTDTTLFYVTADLETAPVSAGLEEDSADDPALFRLFSDTSVVIIAGSNKTAGIHFYDISGKEIGFFKCGRINNIDSRSIEMPGGGKKILLAGSNRSLNSISLFLLSETSPVSADTVINIVSDLDEVYGLCLYEEKHTGGLFVFVNSKTGNIEQWELVVGSKDLEASRVRKFAVPSQPEGMVADDRTGKLYVGEERGGIHVFEIHTEADPGYCTIERSDSLNPNIRYDIEGLAIYRSGSAGGYLVASSQGNNTFAVFDLDKQIYLRSFAVLEEITDSVEETDGVEILDTYVSDRYPEGILVVQDGYNTNGKIIKPQNFKIIDWRKISRFLK
ncbi:MAG: phytase [Bacteroidales bacterium]